MQWSVKFVGVIALAVAVLLSWGASSAMAFQEEEKPAESAPAEGGGSATSDDLQARQQESFLSWTIRSSGVFGAIIGIQSFFLTAMIMMHFLQYRRDNMLPPDFIEQFEQKLNARDYQGAYELAKTDESLLGKVVTSGLSRLNRGYPEALEGMQEVMEDENMALEHKLSYIGMIGSLAPMLGLMGTVQGMISSFRVISTSPTTPKPYELADGISTALFTTIEGLIVAIPAIMAFGYFKNRLGRTMLEVGMIGEGLMSRFANMGKKPAAAGGTAPAAAPAAPQQ